MRERIRRCIEKWTGASKAIAFVDYEYWFYSYQKLYGLKPDPKLWRSELEKQFELEDIMVFGDFSPAGMSGELPGIREITNTIIETGNTFAHYKKDMTDFIMLDYIYQYAVDHRRINTYILFTGDGHFQSVAKYLVQKKHKRVIVYGITDSFSVQLQAAATETVTIPLQSELLPRYYGMILENLDRVASNPKIIPTFNGTADAVASANGVQPDAVRATLRHMLAKGYILRKDYRVGFNRTVKIVQPDWELLIRDGLWKVED